MYVTRTSLWYELIWRRTKKLKRASLISGVFRRAPSLELRYIIIVSKLSHSKLLPNLNNSQPQKPIPTVRSVAHRHPQPKLKSPILVIRLRRLVHCLPVHVHRVSKVPNARRLGGESELAHDACIHERDPSHRVRVPRLTIGECEITRLRRLGHRWLIVTIDCRVRQRHVWKSIARDQWRSD